MQLTGTMSTKYYLLSLLGALMVAVGVLTVSPSAQAQVEPPPPTIDKECTPNPVQVGQTLTCTIDVLPAPDTRVFVGVEDTLPDGLTVTGAISEEIRNGVAFNILPCKVEGNTVTCPGGGNAVLRNVAESFRATIEATAEQCGTFTNTARATGDVEFDSMPGRAQFSESDTEQITVEGCEEPLPPVPGLPGDQQQQQQEPACTPTVQEEIAQEAHSGEVGLSGAVENSGDYAGQTVAPLQFGDSGNLQNAPGVLQACGSEMGDFESGGISKEISPSLDIASDRAIGQSSGTSG